FQAEDGIRDFHVTGVQTCALPISHRPRRPLRHALEDPRRAGRSGAPPRRGDLRGRAPRDRAPPEPPRGLLPRAPLRLAARANGEIGRASCRSNVYRCMLANYVITV